MANDALIEEGNTQWWHEEVQIQLRRRRRDNNSENERAPKTEKSDG